MSAPWASPGARRTGPLFPAWDHAADAGPYRVPAPHYGTDLGPARGHCYDEHLRCYGCGATWRKDPGLCDEPRKAREGARATGGANSRLRLRSARKAGGDS